MHNKTFVRRAAVAGTLGLLAVASACTLKSPEAPSLTGPSELATSVTVTASPDILTQDGNSQAIVTIFVRNETARPVPNVPMRLDILVNGFVNNSFGQLSQQSAVTGSDGRATVVYTAPLAPASSEDPGTDVRIWVELVGANYDNIVGRSASIRLVRPGVVLVPGAPLPDFSFTPATPGVGVDVQFNAQASRDDDGVIVRYEWNYGDGEIETGIVQQHDFTVAGTYDVTLTVTDDDGLKASKTRSITVVP